MHTFEVEVKSLLGTKDRADALRASLLSLDPSCTCTSKNTQLNHYFVGGTIKDLLAAVSVHLTPEARVRLEDIASRAKEVSVRSRKKDNDVILVVKASVGDDTSANGVSRIEFEETLPLSLETLDELILSAGFSYQAKWSREREEYTLKDMTVCIDKNAGYGYLAEFEKIIESEDGVQAARAEIDALMASVGVEELRQDRLERMFAYYNTHWPEYYGTDNIFVIE